MRKSFLVLFTGTLAGKILGFLREVLLAAIYGSGALSDAYRGSHTATFVPLHFLLNDVLNAGFLPLMKKYSSQSESKALLFFKSVYVFLLVFSIVISILLILIRGHWTEIVVPGFDEGTKLIVRQMIIAMALALPFYTQSLLLAYLEMANGSYFLISLRVVIFNVGLILGIVLSYVLSNILLIGWVIPFFFFLYFIVALTRVKSKGYYRPVAGLQFSYFRKSVGVLFKLILPLLVLSFFVQVNIVVERSVASNFGEGTLSSLDYSKVLIESLSILIAAPLGLISLTEFVVLSTEEVKKRTMKILIPILIVLVPLASVLYFDCYHVISLIYERGKFDSESVQLSASILKYMAIGSWATVLSYFLLKVLNARMQNTAVLKISTIAVVAQMGINYFCNEFFGPGVLGLSYSIYGILIFGMTILHLGVTEKVFKYLAILVLGILPLAFLKATVTTDYSVIEILWTTLYWAAFIFILKPLQKQVSIFLKMSLKR